MIKVINEITEKFLKMTRFPDILEIHKNYPTISDNFQDWLKEQDIEAVLIYDKIQAIILNNRN